MLRLASIALALVLITSSAFAGVITSVNAISGGGLGSVNIPVIYTPNPDNDNQTGGGPEDNNITVPIKRFDYNAPIDIVFNVSNTNGTTEYKFFENVDNNTGLNWIGYRMQLGYGTGADFTPALVGGGLDFDAPNYDPPPSSTGFSTVLTSENELVFTSGIQGTASQNYQFRIDVPNIDRGTFTLRQIPIPVEVPEPSTLVLLGMSAIGLAYAWRRRS